MKRRFYDLRRITFLSALVLFLSAAPQTSMAQQRLKAGAIAPPTEERECDNHITSNTELVSLTVTVTDKQGRYISRLDRGAFAVYEDDVRQEISFFSDLDAPASVGVVFDVSGSMRGEKIIRARDALARFIQYSIGYAPTNVARVGEWRRLKGAVAQPAGSPRLVVRSRKGYYAVPGQSVHKGSTEGESDE